jgi:hypothetical protein
MSNKESYINEIPYCSEKLIKDLIDSMKKENFAIAEEDLNRLKERLRIEEFYSKEIEKNFENLLLFVKNNDHVSTLKSLQDLISKLRDIDIQYLLKLVNTNDDFLKFLKDKSIYLLIGLTGSGNIFYKVKKFQINQIIYQY